MCMQMTDVYLVIYVFYIIMTGFLKVQLLLKLQVKV